MNINNDEEVWFAAYLASLTGQSAHRHTINPGQAICNAEEALKHLRERFPKKVDSWENGEPPPG